MVHEHPSDRIQWESLRIISIVPWIVWLACTLILLSLVGWRIYARIETPITFAFPVMTHAVYSR